MPLVLTTRAHIQCPHGGIGASTAKHPLWRVEGGTVLVEGDTGVLSCVNVVPCVGYILHSMGLNAMRIDGLPVLLATDFNRTLTGLPLTIVEAQATTVDESSPAPLAPGQPAPPLSPAAADTAVPVVTVIPPPTPAYNSSTKTPPTLPVSFDLSAPFPLRWILTLIGDADPPSSGDLTLVQPVGIALAPSGGLWEAPHLTVTLTLALPFLATLKVGAYRFVMTAVSQRGRFGSGEFTLNVS